MGRRSAASQVPPAGLVALVALVALGLPHASSGCYDLKIARSQPDTLDPSSPGNDGGTDASGTTGDGGAGDAVADATSPPPLRYYADVQAALEAKRFAGPTTGMSARGHCTPSTFVWVDSDDSIHSWRGPTKARIDYGFKDTSFVSFLFPSDAFYAVQRPFVFVDVYRMDVPNVLVTSLPYSESFVSASNGVLLLDQKSGGVDLGGTKVRRWNATTMLTEDITGVLATREEPTSFVSDTLVIPGGKTPPHSIHIVDVVKKTATSVLFDKATALAQTEPSADGLLVAYVDGSSGALLRLYKGNASAAAARVELGPDIDAQPAYFEDPPTNGLEHDFQPPIASWGKRVLFSSVYGIWSYDLVTKTIAPVQLSAGKVPGSPKIMCVMRDAGLLVYQTNADPTQQVWAVPLAALFP